MAVKQNNEREDTKPMYKVGIILKNKCMVGQGSSNKFSELLKELGIKDTEKNAMTKFVEIEISPYDNEWWTHPSTWNCYTCRENNPDWFNNNEAYYVEEFKKTVISWWEKHVLVNKTIDEISSGYYKLKSCKIKRLCKDAQVELNDSVIQKMEDNSTVLAMNNNSIVHKMSDNSMIQKVYYDSIVQEMYDNSTIQKMNCNSIVEKMYDCSVIQKMYDNSMIESMCNNSKVCKMNDSSMIQGVYHNSVVEKMLKRSMIQEMYGNSVVQEMHDNSTIQEMYGNSTVQNMYDNTIARDCDNNVLMVANNKSLKLQKHINNSKR